MGRRRKTSEELERKGAFDKNPARGRARANEPKPKHGLGDPPADFCNEHSPTSIALREIWFELLDQAKEVKLTSADRVHFEMTCRLVYRCRRPGAKNSDFGQLDRFLSKLGLNPADRSRVKGLKEEGAEGFEGEKDGWGDFSEPAAEARLQ